MKLCLVGGMEFWIKIVFFFISLILVVEFIGILFIVLNIVWLVCINGVIVYGLNNWNLGIDVIKFVDKKDMLVIVVMDLFWVLFLGMLYIVRYVFSCWVGIFFRLMKVFVLLIKFVLIIILGWIIRDRIWLFKFIGVLWILNVLGKNILFKMFLGIDYLILFIVFFSVSISSF